MGISRLRQDDLMEENAAETQRRVDTMNMCAAVWSLRRLTSMQVQVA